MLPKPSSEPKHGLVKVRFIKKFDSYEVMPGDVKYVGKSAADRLLNKYGVIEDPYRRKKGTELTKVIVLNSLVKKFGAAWFPGSEHDVDIRQVQEYLDSGHLMLSAELEENENEYGLLGGKGIEKVQDMQQCYEVRESFEYDHKRWSKGLHFCNNVLDFTAQLQEGLLFKIQ